MKVRASIGTLGVLGLELVQMDFPPTTAYLQIYTEKRCRANCLFCAQARNSTANLSNIARGVYLPVELDDVVLRLRMAYERGYLFRVCIQTILYDTWWEDTTYLIKKIRSESQIPISLSVFPLSDERYMLLKKIGVDNIVIPLDACTKDLFDRIKGKGAGGPFSWSKHIEGIKRASKIFENVGTHLILGMGESDEEAVSIIDELWKYGVNPALFSYTCIPGTQLPEKKVDIKHYRAVQLARYLIVKGLSSYGAMSFNKGVLCDYGVDRNTILGIIEEGEAFQTAGCSNCNRPMANETFSRIYNFPKKPNQKEIEEIKKELELK